MYHLTELKHNFCAT